MSQPYPYLALEDDQEMIIISTGTATPGDYALVRHSWSPATSAYIPGHIVTDPYGLVIEELDINVTGSSVSAIYANIQRIVQFLHRAQWRGQNEETIVPRVRYAPQGSVVATSDAPLFARVLGPPPGESGVALPPNWSDIALQRQAVDVRIRFVRHGRWILPAPTNDPADSFQMSNVGNNGDILSVTFPSAYYTLMPIDIDFAPDVPISGIVTLPSGYACISTGEPIIKMEAEVTPGHSAYTIVSDTAAKASGGNVLRITPNTTNLIEPNFVGASITPDPAIVKRVPRVVIAVIRQSTTSRQFWLRFDALDNPEGTTNTIGVVKTDLVAMPRVTTPTPVVLGILPPANITDNSNTIRCRIAVQVDSISGSPYIDIDYIAFIPIPFNRAGRAIFHRSYTPSESLTSGLFFSIVNRPWRYSTARIAYARYIGGNYTAFLNIGYDDSIGIEGYFPQNNQSAYGLWITPFNGYWRYLHPSTNDVMQIQLRVRRHRSFITPE